MTRSITDPYTSLAPGVPDSIAGRSIVVHAANGTRIACANLTMLSAMGGGWACPGNMSNSSSPTGWMSWSSNATILPSIYGSGAERRTGANFVGRVALAAAVVLSDWML
jgi:hypothetical protein